jgi:hypothetical protein
LFALVKYSSNFLAEHVPAGARSSYEIEIIARLRRKIWIDGDHNSLENIQRRETTNAAAIEAEKIEISARHILSSGIDACVVAAQI